MSQMHGHVTVVRPWRGTTIRIELYKMVNCDESVEASMVKKARGVQGVADAELEGNVITVEVERLHVGNAERVAKNVIKALEVWVHQKGKTKVEYV